MPDWLDQHLVRFVRNHLKWDWFLNERAVHVIPFAWTGIFAFNKNNIEHSMAKHLVDSSSVWNGFKEIELEIEWKVEKRRARKVCEWRRWQQCWHRTLFPINGLPENVFHRFESASLCLPWHVVASIDNRVNNNSNFLDVIPISFGAHIDCWSCEYLHV